MSYAIRSEAEARYPQYVSGQRDFKAWAKRIVFRHSQGDKTLNHAQIKFAYEAMKMAEGESLNSCQ
ncbi:MAG: hypothetical protein JO253_03060 [Alphaproteobacteria bacterium]|nr:hypothetical protein [Alphaproteobacteria bacterium]